MRKLTVYFALFSSTATTAFASENHLETIVVEGRKTNLVGEVVSASEGVVGQNEIALRPLSRTGEILELIPGMVVTQHSGSGKANQYFLRGFNLDHGTDFATHVDGMPVNMRSHGHGQGYTDLSFLIPETVAQMHYLKGAYYADIGGFSGAGGVHITTANKLENNLASLGLGENGYQRALLMSELQWLNGTSVLAIERQFYDGPWVDVAEDVNKTNFLLRHTLPLSDGQISVAFMGYDNAWNSADQIPLRAVQQQMIPALGSLDNSVGGESQRYSLSVDIQNTAWHGSAYLIDYGLNLWSNFTYFLDDEASGDQFEQVDSRKIYGGQLDYNWATSFASTPTSNRLGLQLRIDDISEVGLYQTQRRQRLGVTRSDSIDQQSVSVFFENRADWNYHLRTVLGARYDALRFDVGDRVGLNRFGVDLSDNSGDTDDDLFSLKGSLIYRINEIWEVYISAGQGFHSNDARGTTIKIDPSSGASVDDVDPLVRSNGYETGIRGAVGDKLTFSAAAWSLQLDSELLFVGDAGNTEASRSSRRQGLELVAYYYFTPLLSADLEYAYTDAAFRGQAPEGKEIPGALQDVLQIGLNLNNEKGWFGSLRYRYFGARPLIEDGSTKSDSTSIVNLRLGYGHTHWSATLDVLNVTDSNDHDIDYFYASRLTSEPSGSGTEDIHFHPLEPRNVRLALEYRW